MDKHDLSSSSSSSASGPGFFNHVFAFDDNSKSEILNLLQYAFLALIPVLVLNKSIQKYVPESDDRKGSVEITLEIAVQLIVMLAGLLLIHRMVTYVPTHSGAPYPEIHLVVNVLTFLMITLSLQSKLGEKISILVERLQDAWTGGKRTGARPAAQVKVSQPMAQQQQQQPHMAMMSPPAFQDGTSISSLPNYEGMQQSPPQQQQQQQPSGLQQDMMGGGFSDEPMAANSLLGGGGSWTSF